MIGSLAGDRVVLDVPGSATAPVASFDSIPLAFIQQQTNLAQVYLSAAQTVIVENHSSWDIVAMISYSGSQTLFPVVVSRYKSRIISSRINTADSLVLQTLQDRPLILQSLSEWQDAALTNSQVPGFQIAGYVPSGFVTVTGMTDDITISSTDLVSSGAEPQWYVATDAIAPAALTSQLLLTDFSYGIVRLDLWNRSDGDLFFSWSGRKTIPSTHASSGFVDAGRKELHLQSGESQSMDCQLDPVTTLYVRNPQVVDAGFQYMTWGS